MNLTNEQKARLLDALEADGVDNWSGYNIEGGSYEAMLEDIRVENDFEENRKKLEPLFEIIEENIEVDFPVGKEAGHRAVITQDGIKEIVNFIIKNY